MIIYVAQYNYAGPSITSFEVEKETNHFWYVDESTKKYLLGRSTYIGKKLQKKPRGYSEVFPFLTIGDALNCLMAEIDRNRAHFKRKLEEVLVYEKMVMNYKEE